MTGKVTEFVIYSGRVQGVGFRYAVQSIAKRHRLKGYVKNLADGGVELIIQGNPDDISALLGEVASQFRDNIRRCERRPVESSEAFEFFEIRS